MAMVMAMGLLFGVVLAILCLCVESAQFSATTRPSEVAALQGLLRAWNKPTNLLDTWSLEEDADPCLSRWKGVYCRRSSSKYSYIVTGLNLSNLSLVGNIPPEIGDLRNLRSLDLSGNSVLTGAIPRQIGSLHQLITLDFSGCDLSVDTSLLLIALKNLKNLSGCHLSGVVPRALSSLDKLQNLDLSNNIRLIFPQETQELTKPSNSRFEMRKIHDLRSLRHHHHRTLMQATPAPPTPAVAPPPKAVTKTPPPPNQATVARRYLIYVGIGAFVFVCLMVVLYLWCRVRTTKRAAHGRGKLPALPRFG